MTYIGQVFLHKDENGLVMKYQIGLWHEQKADPSTQARVVQLIARTKPVPYAMAPVQMRFKCELFLKQAQGEHYGLDWVVVSTKNNEIRLEFQPQDDIMSLFSPMQRAAHQGVVFFDGRVGITEGQADIRVLDRKEGWE